jgi:hypothetical protein
MAGGLQGPPAFCDELIFSIMKRAVVVWLQGRVRLRRWDKAEYDYQHALFHPLAGEDTGQFKP